VEICEQRHMLPMQLSFRKLLGNRYAFPQALCFPLMRVDTNKQQGCSILRSVQPDTFNSSFLLIFRRI